MVLPQQWNDAGPQVLSSGQSVLHPGQTVVLRGQLMVHLVPPVQPVMPGASSALNWSHFKPEVLGKTDADLLRTNK